MARIRSNSPKPNQHRAWPNQRRHHLGIIIHNYQNARQYSKHGEAERRVCCWLRRPCRIFLLKSTSHFLFKGQPNVHVLFQYKRHPRSALHPATHKAVTFSVWNTKLHEYPETSLLRYPFLCIADHAPSRSDEVAHILYSSRTKKLCGATTWAVEPMISSTSVSYLKNRVRQTIHEQLSLTDSSDHDVLSYTKEGISKKGWFRVLV